MTPTSSLKAAPGLSARLTYDQLHERACVCCGRDDVELVRAGFRTVAGLAWAVKACAEHRQAEQ